MQFVWVKTRFVVMKIIWGILKTFEDLCSFNDALHKNL